MKRKNKKPVLEIDKRIYSERVRRVKGYVVGIDGGGTKTVAALANLRGKILKTAKSGSSSFIKIGVRKAVSNIIEAIEKLLKNNKKAKILSTFIALAAIEENKEFKKIIKEKLSFEPKISQIFKGKVIIDSDQIEGFRVGTDEKEGIVLIAGTGSVAHGWRREKEAHASGWGWLSDEGSGFWVGQKAFQAVFKDLDGRDSKTIMTNLFLKKFNVKRVEDLKRKIYLRNNLIKNVSSLSILVDEAVQKKDRIAKEILTKAGEELALTATTVIKELKLERVEFPLVFIGGMFKSKIVLNKAKKEIKKIAPKVKFIRPKKEPVVGAVKLAIERIS